MISLPTVRTAPTSLSLPAVIVQAEGEPLGDGAIWANALPDLGDGAVDRDFHRNHHVGRILDRAAGRRRRRRRRLGGGRPCETVEADRADRHGTTDIISHQNPPKWRCRTLLSRRHILAQAGWIANRLNTDASRRGAPAPATAGTRELTAPRREKPATIPRQRGTPYVAAGRGTRAEESEHANSTQVSCCGDRARAR